MRKYTVATDGLRDDLGDDALWAHAIAALDEYHRFLILDRFALSEFCSGVFAILRNLKNPQVILDRATVPLRVRPLRFCFRLRP